MVSKVYVDSVAYIPRDIANEEVIEYDLAFKNPAYEQKVRFGSKFGEIPPKYLQFWGVTDEYYIVPRNFPETFIKKNAHYKIVEETIEVPFKNTARNYFSACLRDYQEPFVESIQKSIQNDSNDVLIQAPCGHGKTIMTIAVIAKYLKQKTVVLVPTNFLAEQWEESFNKFTKNLRVTRVHAKRKIVISDFTESDIIILTNDLLLSIDNIISTPNAHARFYGLEKIGKPRKFFRELFGCVVLDEYHRFGAHSWVKAIEMFNAKYRITCTATPRRGDDMFKLLEMHTGKRFVMDNKFAPADIYLMPTGADVYPAMSLKAESKLRDIKEPIDSFRNKVERFYDFLDEYALCKGYTSEDFPFVDVDQAFAAIKNVKKTDAKSFERCLTFIAETMTTSVVDTALVYHTKRSKLLQSVMSAALEGGRTVLVLSKRRDMLLTMEEVFREKGYKTCAIVGNAKNKKELLAYAKTEANIVFGIIQLAQEGLDIDRLDTLILIHALSDLEQAVGRTIRVLKDGAKKKPTVIIPKDDNQYSLSQMFKGLKNRGHATVKGELEPTFIRQLLKNGN